MEIVIRFNGRIEAGDHVHYCLERGAVTGMDVDGVRRDAPLYCPLCGALTTTKLADVRPPEIDRQPEYSGPRCAHGYPDAACADLAPDQEPGWTAVYQYRVPEYRAAVLGGGRTIVRWARPCPLCRHQFLSKHYGLLEYELRDLCALLAKRSKTAIEQVGRLQSDLNLVHALLEDVIRHEARVAEDQGLVVRGYVYAITDGKAIKIGWSTRHPASIGGRLSQLQTAHPADLTLLGAVIADAALERELHSRFSEYRIRGEWFRYAPAIVEYFGEA